MDDNVKTLQGKKILHAPFEIAGNMARICRFLRKEGVDATDVNFFDTWLKYQCTENLHINQLPIEDQGRVRDEFFRDALEKYDIFHFHFAHSIYPDFHDLAILRSMGKKILFSFWGSDERAPEWILYHQAKFLGYDPPKPYFLTYDIYRVHQLINRYADVIIGWTCAPRGLILGGMIDVHEWTLEEKNRLIQEYPMEKDPNKVYFLHSATSNWKKGSNIITRLLNECIREGMPIELLSVSGLPTDEAKRIYAHADYAITQVGGGGFGLFGMEMMSWGIPILCSMSKWMNRIRNTPPVMEITKANFREQILNAIEWRDDYRWYYDKQFEIQDWVYENCDMSKWVDEYIDIYARLMRGESVPQHINLAWYQQEAMMQSGIKSDFYKYMIEHNVFEELEIEVSGYDGRLYN